MISFSRLIPELMCLFLFFICSFFSNAFTAGNPFWKQNYLELVYGMVCYGSTILDQFVTCRSLPCLCKITIKYKFATSGPRPRDDGISNSPPTSYETPRIIFESGQPGLIAPIPFSAGLSTSHSPPNNYTDLLHPDSPPLERQGGRVGKSINYNGHTT